VIVCIPFSKPQHVGTVLANVARQEVRPRLLVVVENGPGVGAWEGAERLTDVPRVVLRAEAHQSVARNAAIRYLRDRGESGAIAFWDCDDYYGPGYTRELSAAIRPGRLCGKTRVIHIDNQGLFWSDDYGVENEPCEYLLGATLGMRLEDAAAFPRIQIGEDTIYSHTWRKAGGEVWSTSKLHFCYMRNDAMRGHLYRENIRERLKRSGCRVTSYPANRLVEIVNGGIHYGKEQGPSRAACPAGERNDGCGFGDRERAHAADCRGRAGDSVAAGERRHGW
jgi:glycosyltransferase involved in cell wall biosynthesis